MQATKTCLRSRVIIFYLVVLLQSVCTLMINSTIVFRLHTSSAYRQRISV